MKKKIVGLLMFLLAAAFIAAGIRQGGNAILGGVALAALFVFFGLRLFKANTKKEKTNNNAESLVYVVQGGDKYHRKSNCPAVAHKNTYTMKKSLAVSQGMTPCKKCYPYMK